MRKLLLLLVFAMGLFAQVPKAAVTGRVLLPGDKTQQGLMVRVFRVDRASGTDFTEQDQTTTAADGSFRTKELPYGKYQVCVGVDPMMGVVDPCEWGQPANDLNASAGRGEVIRLQAGTRLVFRLADPEMKLRHPRELGGDRQAALVGVFDAAGFFHMAKITGVSDNEQIWALPVPKGVSYTLHVSGPGMTFGGKEQVTDALSLAGKEDDEVAVRVTVEGKK